MQDNKKKFKSVKTLSARPSNSIATDRWQQSTLEEVSFSELMKEHSEANCQTNEHSAREPLAFKLYSQPGQQADHNPFRKKEAGSKELPVYVNRKSLHILEEQSKKGQKYVPIHLRINNDLLKKMEHINRIKDEQVAKREKEMKECTFKPSIITTSKTADRKPSDVVDGLFKWSQSTQHRLMEKRVIREKEQLSMCRMADKENREELSGRMSFRSATTANDELTLGLAPAIEETQTPQLQTPSGSLSTTKKKYRNKSFNAILDMIH